MKSRGTKLSVLACLSLSMLMFSGQPALADAFGDGVKKYNAKDYQGALNLFKQVAAGQPRNALCHYYLALCNQCLARVDEAKKEYKLATESPDPSLRSMAQTGLSQLDRVKIGPVSAITGGSGNSLVSLEVPAGGAGKGKDGKDGKDGGKDGKAKDSGKAESGSSSGSGGTAAAKGGSAGGVKTIYYFYTNWSRTAKIMDPTIDNAKAQYPKINFKRIDIEAPENQQLLQTYGVTGNGNDPTTVMVDGNGKIVNSYTGCVEGSGFTSMIDEANAKK